MRSGAPQGPQERIRYCCTRGLFVVLILLGLSTLGVHFQALAQSDEDEWTTPVNLSHSGAASSPAIVAGPDGTLRVFWWDQFDGLTVADGAASELAPIKVEGAVLDSEAWSEPARASIFTVEIPEVETTGAEAGGTTQEAEPIITPIEAMPRIVAGATGRAHAFWLGEPNEPEEPGEPDEETGFRPLMYSRLAAGNTSWAWGDALARSALTFDIATDAAGALHLVYVRPSHSQSFPAGLYYRRSDNGGATWSTSSAIYQSRYLRLLPENAHLDLVADEAGGLYVAWDNPRSGQVSLAYSADDGVTWQISGPIGDAEGRPRGGQIIPGPEGEALLLWEDARVQGACRLYQNLVSQLLTGAGGGGQRVLEGLTTCLENKRFLPFGEGQVLMVASSGGEALVLAAWNGEQWSESRRLNFRFVDPELGEQVTLSDLQVALVQAPPSEENEQTTEMLVVVGTDQNGEIWITGSQVVTVERTFAPPSLLPTPLPGEGEVETEPSGPVNLSRSGAVSSPAIVAGPEDTLHVFWWDRFDGLMVAGGVVLASTVLSGTEETSGTFEVWSEPRTVPVPVATIPRIMVDGGGRVHAFWLQAADEETDIRPLMHSRLTARGTAWSLPIVVAESAVSFDVATDGFGTLHLAYLRALHTSDSPAGLYYRRSEDGGGFWNSPTALRQSRYFRLLAPENAHLCLTADDDGGVYVTWDDPHQALLMLTYSSDGGATWGESGSVDDVDGRPQQGRLVAVPGGETVLLWKDVRAGGICNLYQSPAKELLAGKEGGGQRVLEGLMICPQNELFLPLGEGQALMVAGSGSDVLTVAAWDGSQWSEPRRLSFRFEDAESGEQVYLSGLQATLVQGFPNGEGLASKALIAVGTDQEGDVWATSSQMSALEMVFAPSPPWLAPVNLSESQALPGLPAVAADAEGRVHVLWSEAPAPGGPETALFYTRWDGSTGPALSGVEGLTTGGTRWMRPVEVLRSPDASTGSGLGGGAEEPALAAVGDRLHAVWSGGQNGEIFCSRAFLRDAYSAGGWSDPQSLPAPAAVGSWPDIAADPSGALHVVYAMPLNEGRGVYHVRSDDEGENWSPAQRIFDAAAAGWAMADYPRLAIDVEGILHVVWVRAALPGGGLPQGVYYARSSDGGQTWSGPLEVADGAYTWPEVAVSGTGQVHLLWNEATGGGAWWHRWSTDSGGGWTRPERVRGFGDVPGPVGFVSDGAGELYLTGLGKDDAGESALLYTTWDGERWSGGETFRLEWNREVEPGVAAALQPALGRLDVAFRGEVQEGDMTQVDLWHTGRAVPAVTVTPASALPAKPSESVQDKAPDKALASSATATSPSTPTPTPDFSRALPPTAGGSMDMPLPLVLAGGLAALIVVGVFGTRLLLAGRR